MELRRKKGKRGSMNALTCMYGLPFRRDYVPELGVLLGLPSFRGFAPVLGLTDAYRLERGAFNYTGDDEPNPSRFGRRPLLTPSRAYADV